MNEKALVHKFYVGNNGSSHYTFSAPGHVWFDSDIGVENDRIEKIKRQIKQNRKNKRNNKSSFGSKGFSSNF